MPDPEAITNALIAKLGADSTLLAKVPNGVFRDVAGANATRFVIVSLVIGEDISGFGQRSIEDRLYLVEARLRSDMPNSLSDVAVAANRIDTLLDPQPPAPPATLAVTGYTLMSLTREEPVESTERDENVTNIFWFRRGGRYRVVMSLD